jgi:hypothetical protein
VQGKEIPVKKNVKMNVVVLTAAIVMLSAGCDPSVGDEGPEISGTWIDTIYNTKITFTADSYQSYAGLEDTVPSYECEITDFDNRGWNGGDTGAGDCGYAVLRFTKAPSWNTAAEGTYTILRWQNLKSVGLVTTMEYLEGADSTAFPAPITYFDTPEEAVSGAVTGSAWFSFPYAAVTLQQ